MSVAGSRQTPPAEAERLTALRRRLQAYHSARGSEAVIESLMFLCAFLSVLTTVGIIVVLVLESWHFFRVVPLWDFLTGTVWSPLIAPKSYGVLPLVVGTLHIVVGSCVLALPVGLAIGIYLSEYASKTTRSYVKPVLEVLAGIPTVVYGYFALTFLTPTLQPLFARMGLQMEVYNSLSASFVVGIMILPTVASLCEDALRAVPNHLREGAYALGATPFEVSLRVVVPSALSGILAAFILAMSRAIGETMAVALAAGATPTLTANPLVSIQTMTGYIVAVSKGDTPAGSVEYYSLFAVAALLFLITLGLNLLANRILHHFREEYD